LHVSVGAEDEDGTDEDDGLILGYNDMDGVIDGCVGRLALGGDDHDGDRLIEGIDEGVVTNGIVKATDSDPPNFPPSAITPPFVVVTL
jgi:hypothetical protein